MPHRKKVNILLVDDHEEGLLALEAVLKDPKYNLIRAHSGDEALAAVLGLDFAVILMDVQMPGLDGFETVNLIKQRERSKDIPVIFVTAINKEDEFVRRGYKTGAIDYIFKPFDPFVLNLKVAAFVDLYQKTKQLLEQAEMLRQSEIRDRARQLTTLQLESANRYRHLADSIPHIIWKFRGDGTLDYCNRLWQEYSGLTLEQSTGAGWQSMVHPEDIQELSEKLNDRLLMGEPFDSECRLLRKLDGAFRWHMLRCVPDLYAGDEAGAWVITLTDIEDRKNMEHDLIRAKEESLAANEAKSSFLANMSHEIRTPLGVVLGFSELMAEADLPNDERKMYLATIQKNGELLSRLIGDVLDLSKIEAGHLEIERVPFSLPDFLFNALQSFQHQAQHKGIRLNATLESAIPRLIHSDPMRLRQILFNIVGNAIKFTDQGEVNIRVKCMVSARGRSVLQIAVSDQGVGISEDQAKQLFQPFIQADSSTTRKYGGTGLGLSLSRKLANKMGGDVILSESALKKGSTFIVTLDVGTLESTQFVDKVGLLQSDESASSRPVQAQALKDLNVLLVEDSHDNQELLTHFLQIAGAQVHIAENGKAGVAQALNGSFDIVLMDLQMPILDGYKATRELRQNSFDKPILALTAHALKEEREKCLAAGCDDHLVKPVNRDELLRKIAHHHRRHQMEDKALH
jgi:two-component system, sensor histidine kinase